MSLFRTYGAAPFTVAVVHGGPGAGGEMAPVARALAARGLPDGAPEGVRPDVGGILEPIQTANTLEGQVAELGAILEQEGDGPLTVIGYSWGAWLGFILAAESPALVRKLVLVSSGPFEAHYVRALGETRMNRLSAGERQEFDAVVRALSDPAATGKDALLARLGALAAKADTYAALPTPDDEDDVLGPRGDIFQGVWEAAAGLRERGELLALGKRIRCPVVAIHGDYDPHPAAGVAEPLSRVLADFRFILLERCGHTPWRERYAREAFYDLLAEVLWHPQ